jgi:hypothetical protein
MALVLGPQIIGCPACGIEFEAVWLSESDTIQDMDEAPVARQTCPDGHTFEAEYPGWTSFTEAG